MRLSATILLGGVTALQALSISDCNCGYKDSTSGELYTDAIIIYFNETQTLPSDVLSAQDFAHKKELGWNSIYRQGASPDNVLISNASQVQWLENAQNTDSLELYLDPSTSGHLVSGGSVISRRQDILHGTFRASMRSPHEWAGGSALSMMLYYNDTSSLEIDLCNMDDSNNAAVTQLLNGDYPDVTWPDRLNYTTIAKGLDDDTPVSPWDYMDLRLDWSKDSVNFSIAGNQSRSVNSKSKIPTEPMPLIFKHWSTGDSKWMEGPPTQRSVANVAWVRAFFNSSLTTTQDQQAFNKQCQASQACNVDDMTLRGSSAYPIEALARYKYAPRNEKWKLPSAIVSGSGAFVGMMMLLNVLVRKAPWGKLFLKSRKAPTVAASEEENRSFEYPNDKSGVIIRSGSSSTLASTGGNESKDKPVNSDDSRNVSRWATPGGPRSPASTINVADENGHVLDVYLLHKRMIEDGVLPPVFTDQTTSLKQKAGSITSDGGWSSNANTLVPTTPDPRGRSPRERELSKFSFIPNETIRESRIFSPSTDEIQVIPSTENFKENFRLEDALREDRHELKPLPAIPTLKSNVGLGITVSEKASSTTLPQSSNLIPEPPQNKAIITPAHNPPPKKRIDYFAGLSVIACLGVTAIHFTLTFVPYAGGLSYGMHYKSEYWARWTVSPIFLDPIWLGPLFVTSCRFLAGKYLQKGNLFDIAQKTLLRAPRMLIPCIIVAFLEYFFIEEGLTAKLQYVPSISWSTWPYLENYSNFGVFINDILELGYLIPNAAPDIISHYCVGVLWTVPVQLQFSYTTLLAAVMVREIKTPWKRFAFYTFCVVNNWYALSWGSCFWLGVMLADLQLTYNYTDWVQARWWFHYPFITFMVCITVAAPLMSLLQDRLNVAAMTNEYGIHPDPSTGLPIAQTSRAGYPGYYDPRVNTLMFAGGLQILIECSTWVQWVFSFKPFLWIFPHTFIIYLVHGFIFWSVGANVVVALAETGLPYWAITIINFIVCYITIAFAVMFLTPFCEGTAQAACRNFWRRASDEPVPKLPTLSPYPKNLFLAKSESSGSDVEATPEMMDTEYEKKGAGVDISEVSSSSTTTSSSATPSIKDGKKFADVDAIEVSAETSASSSVTRL